MSNNKNATRAEDTKYRKAIIDVCIQYLGFDASLDSFINELCDGCRDGMPVAKANRWLGYIQGVLIERGHTTVDVERDATRPIFRPLDYPATDTHHDSSIESVEVLIKAVMNGKFSFGQRVTKSKGSKWTGEIVGFYSTALTPLGYAVESETETGSVQIYPEAALEDAPAYGEQVTLADCPIGLFMSSNGELCLKTEYGNNEGRIDAYIVSTGEFFWGGTRSIPDQRKVLVRRINELY